jgi:hypothetical protein
MSENGVWVRLPGPMPSPKLPRFQTSRTESTLEVLCLVVIVLLK